MGMKIFLYKLKNKAKYFAIIGAIVSTFSVGSLLGFGCCAGYVPEAAREKWEWEEVEEDVDKSEYEKSMMYKYVEEEKIDGKNNWLVLNHMLYYLLGLKAKTGGSHSQAQDFKDQLQYLHFMDDSGKVADIYERAFVGEDMRLEKDSSISNTFIYKDLVQERLPQILRWGGFEQVYGLNEWGELITRLGPLKDISWDSNCVEGIASNGLTYEACEDKYLVFKIEKVALGPIENPLPNFLIMKTGNKLSVPVDYDVLDIRKLGLVKLPCPRVGYWTNAGALFFNSEWDANRIVIDISANVEGFVNEGAADFDLKYIIRNMDREELAKDSTHFNFRTGDNKAFIGRLITTPFPTTDSCYVWVVLSSGEKILVRDSLVAVDSNTYPIEIVNRESIGELNSGVPGFHVGPVKRGEKYFLFFPLEDLSIDYRDSVYRGLANVLLLPERGGKGTTDIGEITILGKDYKPGEEPYLTNDHVILSYGDQYLGTLDLSSKYSKGYFLGEIEIPNDADIGLNFLALEFYKIENPEIGAVEKLGEGYKRIQIE